MTEVLVSELKLTTPPVIPQARSYLTKQQSEYTEYDVYLGNRVRVNIPRLAKSYLTKDSYIRFRLNLDLTGVDTRIMFDRCGAFGLFDRIEVYDYLGGTLLERTSNIPAMTVLVNDITKTFSDYSGNMQATQGFDNPAVGIAHTSYDRFELHAPHTGLVLAQVGDLSVTRSFCYEFCLPVPSFLGMFSDKFVPLHNGFSVDFFLNNPNLAFYSRDGSPDGNPLSYTINAAWLSNFEYCCQIMELGDMAESMVTAQEPLVVHTSMYRYFQDYIQGRTDAQSSFKIDLNLNVVSLKNVRFGMRPAVYQQLRYPSYGHRMRNFLTNFNLQYGSSYLPELAGIACRGTTIPSSRNAFDREYSDDFWKALHYTQAFEELNKTADTYDTSLMSLNEFRIDTAVAEATGNAFDKGLGDYCGPLTGTTFARLPMPDLADESGICGKFAGGIDTRLSKKSILSGIDTNGLQVTLNGTFDQSKIGPDPADWNASTTGYPIQAAILDIWAEHDAFVQIIPGLSTTVTF